MRNFHLQWRGLLRVCWSDLVAQHLWSITSGKVEMKRVRMDPKTMQVCCFPPCLICYMVRNLICNQNSKIIGRSKCDSCMRLIKDDQGVGILEKNGHQIHATFPVSSVLRYQCLYSQWEYFITCKKTNLSTERVTDHSKEGGEGEEAGLCTES